MIQLRQHQIELDQALDAGYAAGASNMLAVSATGSGKTVLFSHRLQKSPGEGIAIAHRQELVAQISQSLARFGVDHKVIAPQALVRHIVQQHTEEFGRSYYHPQAQKAVAGVDTLVRRVDELGDFTKRCNLWVQDEAHHVLRSNKWGKAAEIFPNAKGLGVTATPCRADGKGLGRHADGLFDDMVIGRSERWLIDEGYLTDYRIFCPPNDLDLSNVNVTASGDYSPKQLHKSVQKSHLTGDIVEHYLKLAAGQLGVTFVESVETGEQVRDKYRAAGVPCELVTAKTPDRERADVIKRFKRGELLNLVNVDLFGEGFDLPAVSVVSMGRPTESYGLYAQQFGRALRTTDDPNKVAIIIDHVGNVIRHGLIDQPREWSLDAREKRATKDKDPNEIKLKACPDCTQPYLAALPQCPHCGYIPEPAARTGPEFVDGDLFELTPDVLAKMRGEVNRVDMPADVLRDYMLQGGAHPAAANGAAKNHRIRQEAQRNLRGKIAMWSGYQSALGRPMNEQYRRFWHQFGTDVMTAQSMNKSDAEKLGRAIDENLRRLQVELTRTTSSVA